jgi:hypothetical protein
MLQAQVFFLKKRQERCHSLSEEGKIQEYKSTKRKAGLKTRSAKADQEQRTPSLTKQG